MPNQIFNFNGHNSNEFGIKIERYRNLNRPERKFHANDVPGRNGNIYNVDDCWSESVVSYEIYFVDSVEPSATLAGRIMEWLTEPTGYARLTDTYDPEHYRMAMFLDAVDIENIYNQYGRAIISFRCRPERFLIESDVEVEWSNNQYTLENPTNHNAKPIINFTGLFLTTMFNGYRTRITTVGTAQPFSDLWTTDNKPYEKLCFVGVYANGQYIQSSQITNLSIGNSVSFTPTTADIGVGFPVNVDPNSSYSISYDMTGSMMFRAYEYTESGLFIREINPSIITGNLVLNTSKNAGYIVLVFYGQTANTAVSMDWVMLVEGDTLPPQGAWETSLPTFDTWYKILTVGSNALYTFNRKFNDVTIDAENEIIYNNGVSISRYVKVVNEGNGGYSFFNLVPGDNLIKREINSTVVTATIEPRFWEI